MTLEAPRTRDEAIAFVASWMHQHGWRTLMMELALPAVLIEAPDRLSRAIWSFVAVPGTQLQRWRPRFKLHSFDIERRPTRRHLYRPCRGDRAWYLYCAGSIDPSSLLLREDVPMPPYLPDRLKSAFLQWFEEQFEIV